MNMIETMRQHHYWCVFEWCDIMVYAAVMECFQRTHEIMRDFFVYTSNACA